MTWVRPWIVSVCAGAFVFGCRSPQSSPSAASAGPDVQSPAPQPSPERATAVVAKGSFAFDSATGAEPPPGFSFARTGGGAMGRWVVRSEKDAPSPPNVLAQLDPDSTDSRFPVAVASGVSIRDLRLSARCKPVSGKVDQACGLVFRYRDAGNYYVTRANALEGNIRLYYVKDGERHQLASHNGSVTANAWHEYAVEARGDHFQVYWDGRQVLDHHDATFPDAGLVGVWTKADSVTYFDDLVVGPPSESR